MKSTEASEVQEESSKITNRNEDSVTRDSKKELIRGKKVYVHKNSLLTDMMKVNHFQALHNFCHVVSIYVIVLTLFYYKAEPSKMQEVLRSLRWCFSKFSDFVKYWLLFNLLAAAFYEGFKLWVYIRSRIQSKVADKIFLYLYAVSFWLTFGVTAYFMLKTELPIAWALVASAEQLRIYMKIHSFVRENAARVIQHKPEKDGNQNQVLCPTKKQYWYFIFAPALLYRDSYPRTEKIQWRNVFYYLYQFLLGITLSLCVAVAVGNLFKNVGIRPLTKGKTVLLLGASMVEGTLTTFVIFYTYCHCWNNMFAELLRFGYREFYQDWWNSVTAGQYYRKWNVYMHDWFYNYVYNDLRQIGFNGTFSKTMVFILTGVFHEYGYLIAFRFCLPIFTATFGGCGILLGITRGRTAQTMNCGLWLTVFITGHAIIHLWLLEWFARQNCPKQETFANYFIPRILDPSCKIYAS